MMHHLRLYGVALVTFLAIDLVWLGFVARTFYRKQIGFLLADQPNWWAAIAFYLLFVAGMVVFVIQPAVTENSFRKALLLGAFYGLITYATYDLTSLATTKNWPLAVTLVDMTWGTVLAATVSGVAFSVHRWLG